MPVATQDLIDATLAQVADALPELQVSLYPAVPTTFRLNHPLGALLLAYPGSTSGDSISSLCGANQTRTVRLGWTLVTRQLWGDDGAATLLDTLRSTLIGWTPLAGCAPVQHVREQMLSEEGGLWWYTSEFSVVIYP